MRRMGRFFVGEMILINDQFQGRAIFDGLVILEADHRYDRMGTEYLAIGEVFDEIPEGSAAPQYEVTLSEAGKVEFKRLDDPMAQHLAAVAHHGDRDSDASD